MSFFVKFLIKPSEYHDSVSLMLTARELSKLEGVRDAAVVMATEANKSILAEAGLLTQAAQLATPNDLLIAVSAESDALADAALQKADGLLKKKAAAAETGEFHPKTLRSALAAHPEANVAVISVAGRYATDEAWDALQRGLHVLLFSDNVSLEDEIALKTYARDHGLLLMGPGAGTAILNGVALGFANVLPPGPVGIVSAAGTGLQEVSTLLAKRGVGISQGIGTGGRDLKEAVGGLMMLSGLQALQSDPATEVIVLISKPPADVVAQKVLEQVETSNKTTVVCFLGSISPSSTRGGGRGVMFARTLEEAAIIAAALATHSTVIPTATSNLQPATIHFSPSQRYLRGLFSGGTLCYEAQVIWKDMLLAPVYSNAPLPGGPALVDSTRSQGHTAVDLGEEEFTVGRPHPMIDNDLRIRRLLQEARDPETAVILLDVVIGYGAHPDPAAELAPVIRQAKEIARQDGRELPVIASVTGTEQDPQCLSRQVAALESAGVVVCESNAAAARSAAWMVGAQTA
jgi:succinyl-CoA synthetase alpha subunit